MVLTEKYNFPSDIYIANALLEKKGLPPLKMVETKDLEKALFDKRVSVLMLTQVDYRTGYLHDIKKLTRIAKSQGIVTIWDLAHSKKSVLF